MSSLNSYPPPNYDDPLGDITDIEVVKYWFNNNLLDPKRHYYQDLSSLLEHAETANILIFLLDSGVIYSKDIQFMRILCETISLDALIYIQQEYSISLTSFSYKMTTSSKTNESDNNNNNNIRIVNNWGIYYRIVDLLSTVDIDQVSSLVRQYPSLYFLILSVFPDYIHDPDFVPPDYSENNSLTCDCIDYLICSYYYDTFTPHVFMTVYYRNMDIFTITRLSMQYNHIALQTIINHHHHRTDGSSSLSSFNKQSILNALQSAVNASPLYNHQCICIVMSLDYIQSKKRLLYGATLADNVASVKYILSHIINAPNFDSSQNELNVEFLSSQSKEMVDIFLSLCPRPITKIPSLTYEAFVAALEYTIPQYKRIHHTSDRRNNIPVPHYTFSWQDLLFDLSGASPRVFQLIMSLIKRPKTPLSSLLPSLPQIPLFSLTSRDRHTISTPRIPARIYNHLKLALSDIDIDTRSSSGLTCLGYAYRNNQVQYVKHLLSMNADPNIYQSVETPRRWCLLQYPSDRHDTDGYSYSTSHTPHHPPTIPFDDVHYSQHIIDQSLTLMDISIESSAVIIHQMITAMLLHKAYPYTYCIDRRRTRAGDASLKISSWLQCAISWQYLPLAQTILQYLSPVNLSFIIHPRQSETWTLLDQIVDQSSPTNHKIRKIIIWEFVQYGTSCISPDYITEIPFYDTLLRDALNILDNCNNTYGLHNSDIDGYTDNDTDNMDDGDF